MTSNVNIRLASQRINHCVATSDEIPRLFTPGEIVTEQQGFMRLGYTLCFCRLIFVPLSLNESDFRCCRDSLSVAVLLQSLPFQLYLLLLKINWSAPEVAYGKCLRNRDTVYNLGYARIIMIVVNSYCSCWDC